MSKIIAIICIAMAMAACSHKSEKELEAEQASGVVLVQNKGLYEVELSNGEKLYFSSFDEDGDIKGLSFDADSVEMVSSYGTGFFVDDEGRIATNAHVISSRIEDKEIKRSIGKILNAIKTLLEIQYDNQLEELERLEYALNIANIDPDISYADFYAIKNMRDNAVNGLNEMRSAYSELQNLRSSDSEITYHNEVSIAYNNTHVTKGSDFIECVVTKVDTEHDLALIQLKEKRTPSDKYIFRPAEDDPFETYSLKDKITKSLNGDKNEKLYLHGFNLGPALAITEEGLKAQFTGGAVCQQTSDRLMYTIPALPGSSGSPIVNRSGELVAINFAGLNGTQNFNYGVRVKHLLSLLK